MKNEISGGNRGARRVVSAVGALILCVGVLMTGPGARAAEGIKGDPFRGRELFTERGCIRCHSVWGHGGDLGPDIVVAVQGKTWSRLVGEFWNHTPRMIDEITARGYSWPDLQPQEMADVLTYLYYLLLFDTPGDAEKGRAAWETLQCSACHRLNGKGGRIGQALDRYGAYPSPSVLARGMWNSGPTMQQEQLRRGVDIPQFIGHEMADLQAYIRTEGMRKTREVELQRLPDPQRGAEVYRRKGCWKCHDHPRGQIPDLSRSTLDKTVSEITGLLWNHSYAMSAEMASRGISFPHFEEGEISDLIAYLYLQGYFGKEGDPEAGRRVFESKGCSSCHSGAADAKAPDLSASSRVATREGLAAAMWNHAPQMHESMAEHSGYWPKFEPGEMRDLATYLRKLGNPGTPADR